MAARRPLQLGDEQTALRQGNEFIQGIFTRWHDRIVPGGPNTAGVTATGMAGRFAPIAPCRFDVIEKVAELAICDQRHWLGRRAFRIQIARPGRPNAVRIIGEVKRRVGNHLAELALQTGLPFLRRIARKAAKIDRQQLGGTIFIQDHRHLAARNRRRLKQVGPSRHRLGPDILAARRIPLALRPTIAPAFARPTIFQEHRARGADSILPLVIRHPVGRHHPVFRVRPGDHQTRHSGDPRIGGARCRLDLQPKSFEVRHRHLFQLGIVEAQAFRIRDSAGRRRQHHLGGIVELGIFLRCHKRPLQGFRGQTLGKGNAGAARLHHPNAQAESCGLVDLFHLTIKNPQGQVFTPLQNQVDIRLMVFLRQAQHKLHGATLVH